jgi:hypothetical protein
MVVIRACRRSPTEDRSRAITIVPNLALPRDQLLADDDWPLSELDLFANLRQLIHPACFTAGVMSFVQMSRSLRLSCRVRLYHQKNEGLVTTLTPTPLSTS